MPEITDQQRLFAINYVSSGGKGAEAARAAGYSEKSAREIASQLLHKPHVLQAIQEEQKRTIGGRLCSKAVNVIEQILDDTKASPAVRLDAAYKALSMGGHAARAAPDAPGDDEKPVSEWSVSRLEAFIEKGAPRNADGTPLAH